MTRRRKERKWIARRAKRAQRALSKGIAPGGVLDAIHQYYKDGDPDALQAAVDREHRCIHDFFAPLREAMGLGGS